MASIAELRAIGSRVVGLVTPDGTFEGRILQDRLTDDAVMLMFAPVTPESAFVIAIDAVTSIEER